jgi:SnoaL-like domain
MDSVKRLVAIEAIKNVKARYWYAMDMKDWDALRAVFTDDAVFDMRAERAFAEGHPTDELAPAKEAVDAGDPAVIVGASAIADFIRTIVAGWRTVHHGHAPIVEVQEPDRGTGIWPLFDYIDDGRNALKGYGHYYDEYRKVGGEWLISRVLLTRIRADGSYPSAQRLVQT